MTTPQSHNTHGLSLARESRFAEAVAAFRQAIAADPTYAEAHYNLAKSLKDLGQPDQAVAAYRRTLELHPDFAPAWQNLANLLGETGQTQLAIEAYQRVVTLEPQNPGAHGMLARIFHQANRLEESLPHFQALAHSLPAHAEPLHALGVVLHDLNLLDEAAVAYRRCLTLDLAHAHAAYALGLVHLTQGDFSTGWQLYESRRRLPAPRTVRDYPQPMWNGSPLQGQTILLHAEQGLGDTLQFIRYAPMVTQMGGNVIVQCPAPLVRLLNNQLTITQVIEDASPLPPFDLHCPLLSLPGIFRTTLSSIPAPVPYITPIPADVAHWKSRLESATGWVTDLAAALFPSPGTPGEGREGVGFGFGFPSQRAAHTPPPQPSPGVPVEGEEGRRKCHAPSASPCLPVSLSPRLQLRAGIIWSGSSTHRNDRNRSIAPQAFEILLSIPNLTLVSLQKSGSPPTPTLKASLLDFTPDLSDLADTAALIANLDLVITVDTSIAHLAGAMNKPTWLLLPFAPDWRWLLNRTDSPWYPSLQLFRQPRSNDWSTPLAEIATALQKK